MKRAQLCARLALLLASCTVCGWRGNAFAADSTGDESEEEVMVCEDSGSGKVAYRAAAEAKGDKSCHKLSSTNGSFNQVKDFEGYRTSLEAKSAEADDKPRRKKSKLNESDSGAVDDQSGKTALTSFDYDELQSKKDPKRAQCQVSGETKVNKGCRVEIELIRGALTTISFSRLGRSSANTVKWKRVLEGECRDLTVRAVVSGCE